MSRKKVCHFAPLNLPGRSISLISQAERRGTATCCSPQGPIQMDRYGRRCPRFRRWLSCRDADSSTPCRDRGRWTPSRPLSPWLQTLCWQLGLRGKPTRPHTSLALSCGREMLSSSFLLLSWRILGDGCKAAGCRPLASRVKITSGTTAHV